MSGLWIIAHLSILQDLTFYLNIFKCRKQLFPIICVFLVQTKFGYFVFTKVLYALLFLDCYILISIVLKHFQHLICKYCLDLKYFQYFILFESNFHVFMHNIDFLLSRLATYLKIFWNLIFFVGKNLDCWQIFSKILEFLTFIKTLLYFWQFYLDFLLIVIYEIK